MSCGACVPPQQQYYATSPSMSPQYAMTPVKYPQPQTPAMVAPVHAQQVAPRQQPYGPWASHPSQAAQNPLCGGPAPRCAAQQCAPREYTVCCPPPPIYEHACRTVHYMPMRVNHAPQLRHVSFQHNTMTWGSACPPQPGPCC